MFCQNCGAQVTDTFCTKCGTRASQPSSPAEPAAVHTPQPSDPQISPPPQQVQPPPPVAKSGSGLKILLIVLGIFFFLGVLVIGGLWFGLHKVKQAAANNGIDLDSFSETRRGPARQFDTCELLTKEDLSQILNLTIDRAESNGTSSHSSCSYYSSGAQQRAVDEVDAARKKLEEDTKDGNSKADPSVVANDVGNMVRGMTGASGQAGNGASGPLLSITIDSENAKAAMAAFKLGVGLAGGFAMKQADPSTKGMMSEDIKGVGDEAMSGPLSSLFMFRKGDVSVQLDARMLPGGRDVQIAIARRIISKL